MQRSRSVDELCRKLRAARERAGLTIEEISARTKIGAPTLRALESGDFDRLPGEFYTRTFLRTYARELSLPPEDVLRDYDMMRAPAPVVAATATHDASSDGDALYMTRTDPQPRVRKSNAWAGVIFALLCLAAFAIGWRQASSTGAQAMADGGNVATAAHHEGTPVPTPAGTAGRLDSPAPSAAPQRLTVEVRPTANVWVTAKTDGKKTLFKLLKAGDHVTVVADREVAFRVGNAGAFAYTINGAPGKVVGTSGAVREFTITRDNANTFKQ